MHTFGCKQGIRKSSIHILSNIWGTRISSRPSWQESCLLSWPISRNWVFSSSFSARIEFLSWLNEIEFSLLAFWLGSSFLSWPRIEPSLDFLVGIEFYLLVSRSRLSFLCRLLDWDRAFSPCPSTGIEFLSPSQNRIFSPNPQPGSSFLTQLPAKIEIYLLASQPRSSFLFWPFDQDWMISSCLSTGIKLSLLASRLWSWPLGWD